MRDADLRAHGHRAKDPEDLTDRGCARRSLFRDRRIARLSAERALSDCGDARRGPAPYHELPDGTPLREAPGRARPHAVLRRRKRHGAADGPLRFGEHGPRGLKYEDYKLALTEDAARRRLPTRKLQGPDRCSTSCPGASARAATRARYLSGTRSAAATCSGRHRPASPASTGCAPASRASPQTPRSISSCPSATPIRSATSRDRLPSTRAIFYIESSTDALRQRDARSRDFDYRVLAPRAMQDANAQPAPRCCFDVLGHAGRGRAEGQGHRSGRPRRLHRSICSIRPSLTSSASRTRRR